MTMKIGKRTKTAKRETCRWDNRYFYRCHRLALEGMTDAQIAGVLQIPPGVLQAWKKKRPSLRDAIGEAREELKTMRNGLSGYVFDRLSPEARQVWDRLKTAWEDEDPTARERKLRSLLDGANDSLKKALFLHAVAFSNFDPSAAMKMVGVTRKQVSRWADSDPSFLEAVDEVEFHKKNWFQSKLMRLVELGSESAVIHVNKTYNADMGYGAKREVTVTGQVNHVHETALTLEGLAAYLDMDTLDKIHTAVKAMRAASRPPEVRQLPAHTPDADDRPQDRAVVDGEIVQAGEEAD